MQVRECVRNSNYVITQHAHYAMFDDNLTIIDIEHALLTGQIIEKQRDEITNEPKYLIQGNTPWSDIAVVVAFNIVGRLEIITVYTIEE